MRILSGKQNFILWRGVFSVVLLFVLFLQTVEIVLAQDYLVGEGDVLEISVYDNPDLQSTVRVSGDGSIVVPLLGSVRVAGLSAEQIARQLSSQYANGYLVSPQVLVFVKEYRSKKVTILGQVKNPGLYELQGATSLLELISKAGGMSENVGSQAVIKRKTTGKEGKEENIVIDLKRLVEQGDTSLNIAIVDGDNVYIDKAGIVFVTGEVTRPGSYKCEENFTVIKALTLAGGFNDRASRGKVRIIRKKDDKEVVLEEVKMDTRVKPDDVVVVPESFF